MTSSDPTAALSLRSVEDPAIAEALGAEVVAFGPREERPFSIRAEDGTGALTGGINGVTHWRWLYVRHLWVAESWRGRGLGRRLMEAAEDLARERGCLGLYLDTFDPAAVAFYQRLGYTTCGGLDEFPPGHRRTWLSKLFAPD